MIIIGAIILGIGMIIMMVGTMVEYYFHLNFDIIILDYPIFIEPTMEIGFIIIVIGMVFFIRDYYKLPLEK